MTPSHSAIGTRASLFDGRAFGTREVAEISRFLGLVIYMYYNDHDPPHLHARYGKHEMRMEIPTGRAIAGDLPRRAQQLVAEWTALHRAELLDNWELARARKPLRRIEPLE